MPKNYSEQEWEYIRKGWKEETAICLIQYGVRSTTVDEIVKRVNTPKGLYHKGTGTLRKTQANAPFTALIDEYTPTKGATISRYQQLNRRSTECGNEKQAGLKTTSNSLCA